MRGVVWVLVALLMLAGCAEPQAESEDTAGDVEDPDHTIDAGNVTQGLTGRLVAGLDNTTLDVGVPFNVTLDYIDDNATDAGMMAWNVTFQNATDAVTYNGTGLPTILQANLALVGNVTMTAVASTNEDNVTLEPLRLQLLPAATGPSEPVAEGGSAGARATGAAVVVLNNRAAFDIQFQHDFLEVVPTLDDPLAEQGESYQLRLYFPDGSDSTYSTQNGESIVLENPAPGGYEVTVWPVVAGDYAFTIDYCGFTTLHCSE